MQNILEDERKIIRGTKDCIRQSVEIGLISNVESWLKYLEARNLTVHTYKLEVARTIYSDLKLFIPLVTELLTSATKFYI